MLFNNEMYEQFEKPNWAPPRWVFFVAWAVVFGPYIYSIVLAADQGAGESLTYVLFGLSWLIFILWLVFFRNRAPSVPSLLTIGALYLVVLALAILYALDTATYKGASLLVIPYILFNTFVLVLNIRLRQLNS